MIPRKAYAARIATALKRRPVVVLLGPRQCGKSTLARQVAVQRSSAYYDLENPDDRQRLQSPLRELEQRRGLVVLDEIQQFPDLLPVLRVLADRRPIPARFLLLGSASPDLLKKSSETLAGRIEFIDMSGFDLAEIGAENMRRLWVRGGFPDSYLAGSDAASMVWRGDFIRTFLERDIPRLGLKVPAQLLHRFWTMTAHYHGQIWNSSEIGRSLGISHTTARGYLDILCGALVLRQLQPWHANVGKRLVKAPKVYMCDSGLLHSLLKLPDFDTISSHPKLGASWEGFALEQVLRRTGIRDAYFYATHGGAELDLFYMDGGRRVGVEFKYGDAPATTRSMHVAAEDLKLDQLFVVHPGKNSFPMAERIRAVSIFAIDEITINR